MLAVEIGLSVVLGITFLVAAVPKLRHPKGFAVAVLTYNVLPPRLGQLYAWLVPPLELLVALLLLSGTAVRCAAAATAFLLLSFIIAVSVNMARGRDLDCHCFGKAARRQIGWGLLLQDGALLCAAAAITIIARTWVTVESWSPLGLVGLAPAGSPSPLLGCVVLTVGAAVLFRVSTNTGRRYRNATLSR